MEWQEINVKPQIVVELKMRQVPPISSHPAKIGLTTRKDH